MGSATWARCPRRSSGSDVSWPSQHPLSVARLTEDHEAVSGSPDFETYLASRTPVASILRIVESVVMLVEEISKEDGTCPEDCHLYMVLLGQIAASKRE